MKAILSRLFPFAVSVVFLACSSSNGGDDPDASPPVADAGATRMPDAGEPSSDAATSPEAAVSPEAAPPTDAASMADVATADSGPSATVSCTPNGGGCTCIVESSGDSPVGSCPPAAMPQPQCCANSDYPSTDIAECTCENYACNDLGGGLCFCGVDSTGTAKGASCTGSYAHCCLDTTTNLTCSCGASPCESGDEEVTSCTVDILQCGPDTSRVASCR